jgi:hypothetical protein
VACCELFLPEQPALKYRERSRLGPLARGRGERWRNQRTSSEGDRQVASKVSWDFHSLRFPAEEVAGVGIPGTAWTAVEQLSYIQQGSLDSLADDDV